jgi:putative acetyltransferase
LDHLYCHPLHTRRGLADKLLNEAEKIARKHGNARLYTEASELARASFERAGYAVTHKRDFDLGGVPIHNYAMEKALD